MLMLQILQSESSEQHLANLSRTDEGGREAENTLPVVLHRRPQKSL